MFSKAINGRHKMLPFSLSLSRSPSFSQIEPVVACVLCAVDNNYITAPQCRNLEHSIRVLTQQCGGLPCCVLYSQLFGHYFLLLSDLKMKKKKKKLFCTHRNVIRSPCGQATQTIITRNISRLTVDMVE